MDRMSARSLFAIPRPAASSAARLIRKPEDSLPICFAAAAFELPRIRCVFSAETLVLIRMFVLHPLRVIRGVPAPLCLPPATVPRTG